MVQEEREDRMPDLLSESLERTLMARGTRGAASISHIQLRSDVLACGSGGAASSYKICKGCFELREIYMNKLVYGAKKTLILTFERRHKTLCCAALG